MNISKEELLSIILSQFNTGNTHEKVFKKRFPEHYQEIQKFRFPSNFKFNQKLYHYLYNDFELKLGLCPICGKRCKFKIFRKGYNNHCSYKCAQLNPEVRDKIEQTCEKIYGDKYSTRCESIKEKTKETNNILYGCDYVLQSNEIKEKIKQTNLTKRGVENPAQCKEVQEKMKQTTLKRLGVENASQSELIKQKKQQTCLKNHGVDHFSKTDEFKQKCKETCLKNLGVEYPAQSKEIQEKMRQTTFENWGVEHFTQSSLYHKSHRRQIEYDNLTFDSTWEIEVYKFCKEHDIPCEYQPNIQFTYIFEGGEFVYQPDFLINNQLYEVKGDHFFEGGKMINPYDRTLDEKYESKHQCMIQNNIIILRGEDIKQLDNIIKVEK